MRAVDAKKIAASAIRKAGRVNSDEATNKSTRIRRALKVKADALDEVAAKLAGK